MATVQPGDPIPVECAGPFVHRGSGAAFPERLGSWPRTDCSRYDEAFDNISATYERQLGHLPAVVTFYVYPVPQRPIAEAVASSEPDALSRVMFELLELAFRHMASDILRKHVGWETTAVEPYLEPSGLTGLLITCEADRAWETGSTRVRTTGVVIVPGTRWFLKVRATHAVDKADDVRALIAEGIELLTGGAAGA